jgi:hypothetical protein
MKPVVAFVGTCAWIRLSETTSLVFEVESKPLNLTLKASGLFPPGAKPLPPMLINVPNEPMGGETFVMLWGKAGDAAARRIRNAARPKIRLNFMRLSGLDSAFQIEIARVHAVSD